MSVSAVRRRCLCCFGLLAALVLVISAPREGWAQDAGYLGSLPSAEMVFARFSDAADPVQALGRQCAALDMLERRFFRSVAVMTQAVQAHPETQRVHADYRQGFVRLRERYAAAVGGIDDEKQRLWTAMCDNRSTGGLERPVTLDEVLALVPAAVIAGYTAAYERSDAQVAAMRAAQEAERAREAAAAERAREVADRRAARDRQRRWIGFGVLLLGVIMTVLAGRGLYRLGKYRFNNTTDGGVVQFTSFGAAIRHSLAAQAMMWVFFAGGLIMAVGIFLFFS